MSDFTAKLQIQKQALEKAKEARSKAEATKEQLEKQREQLETECRALGVEPEQLADKIAELEASIVDGIKKVDAMIPEQFRR